MVTGFVEQLAIASLWSLIGFFHLLISFRAAKSIPREKDPWGYRYTVALFICFVIAPPLTTLALAVGDGFVIAILQCVLFIISILLLVWYWLRHFLSRSWRLSLKGLGRYALLIVIIPALLLAMRPVVTSRNEAMTSNENSAALIRNIHSAIEIYVEDYGHLPIALQASEEGRMAALFIELEQGGADSQEGYLWPRGSALTNVYRDDWGEGFHIEITTSPTSPNEMPSPSSPQFLKIWSSGPNRENEQGAGDDIMDSVNVSKLALQQGEMR